MARRVVWLPLGVVAAAAIVLGVVVGIDRAFYAREGQWSWPPRRCVVQEVDARCGTFVVPENRSSPHGRRIGLRVVVLPASAGPVAKDAVAYLQGGPGGAATDLAASLSRAWPGLNLHHDILLVDQRGSGGSNAYYCPEQTKPFSSRAEQRAYTLDCLKGFGGDLTQYGTRMAMDDLDAVRAALGYRQLDVVGGSYAATAAQVYMNLHPSSVRTLTCRGRARSTCPISGASPSTRSVR